VVTSEPIDTGRGSLRPKSRTNVVDLREQDDAAPNGLPMWLDTQANKAGRLLTLILIPPDLVDAVTARVANVRILVEQEWWESNAALADPLEGRQVLTSPVTSRRRRLSTMIWRP
jgi:hypothetical protein